MNQTSLSQLSPTCVLSNPALLVSVSVMSLLGCAYVLISFLYVPALRQHPASIMFGMSIYAACYQIMFLVHVSSDTLTCFKVAALVEFLLAGQESYLLMFALDLILALKNPFAAEKERMIMYHIITALTSAVFALIALLDKDHALFSFCWVEAKSVLNRDPSLGPFMKAQGGSGLSFAVQILVVYLFSLTAMLRSWKTLQRGLPDTFTTRKRILRHLKYYVGIFFAYWTVVFILYAMYAAIPHENALKCRIWNLLSSVLMAKGLVNSIIWTRTSNIYKVFEQLRTIGYVDLPHRDDSINWALRLEILANTTKGICDGISRADTQASSRTVADKRYRFTQIEEISISSKSGADVLFYDYAPHVFRYLRSLSKISSDDYRQSMEQTTKERVSEGKSGAFFYFSQDRKYVVKTLTREELKFLLTILPQYCRYVAKHPETLIARFFGCHAITMYGKTVHFVVIQSVFNTTLQIHERFDLKGSWVGRLEGRKPTGTVAVCKFCSKEYLVGGSHNQRCDARQGGLRHIYDQVGKDLNWNRQMSIPVHTAERLSKQLYKDSMFLQQINSIDYSLLVGIHHRSFSVSNDTTNEYDSLLQNADAPFHRSTFGGMGVDVVHGPGIYFLGIIDILQQWNLRKRIERFIRVYIMRNDRHGVSVAPARAYANRFRQRVVNDLIYDPEGAFRSPVTNPADDIVSMTVLSTDPDTPIIPPNGIELYPPTQIQTHHIPSESQEGNHMGGPIFCKSPPMSVISPCTARSYSMLSEQLQASFHASPAGYSPYHTPQELDRNACLPA